MESAAGEGGFVKGVVTYMVMDDLVVTPMSTISSITMLNKLNVKDVGALEERVVDLGMPEVYIHNTYLQITYAVQVRAFGFLYKPILTSTNTNY